MVKSLHKENFFLKKECLTMSNIAKNIRQYREDHNLTQQELALKLRIGTKKIEMYESGESVPDTQTILRLSTVLDIPASEFLKDAPTGNASGVDEDIKKLIEEIGSKKAELILRTAKDFSEEQILNVMHTLYNTQA
jgi:transcriptional regulator with XRE-family HTH domain